MGSLWTASGTLLGTVTFGPETASGWQQATFATPIAITAGTTYVASYFAPFGNYAEENWYFDAPLDTVPLHAVTDGPGGSVYKYGGTTAFPNQAYKSSNYFVDVVFVETIGGQP